MNDSIKSYAHTFLKTFIILVGLVGGINVIVDPYATIEWICLKHFNLQKPKEGDFARLNKPFRILRYPADIVVFGTSRVERGIDPDYGLLHGLHLYNYGLSGVELYEVLSSVSYIENHHHPKLVVIELNFPLYPLKGFPKIEIEGRYLSSRYLGYYPREWDLSWLIRKCLHHTFSWIGLQHSFETIKANLHEGDVVSHLPNGQLNVAQLGRHDFKRDYHDPFRGVSKKYLDETLQDIVLHYLGSPQGFDHLYLTKILEHTSQHSIQCIFFITPDHATQMECYRLLGLWPVYEQWKRELVSLITQYRSKLPAQSQPQLWDFGGYNSVTMEPVPPLNNATRIMQWYWDPVHYKPATGNAILNRIFHLNDSIFAQVKDFGILLAPSNIESDLVLNHENRKAYVAKNGEIILEITAQLDSKTHRYLAR